MAALPDQSPKATLDPRYSQPGAAPVPWPDAAAALAAAELFWVSTVRADGRPHVTPVVGVWLDGALYFSSGPDEQKSRNLAGHPQCAVTTGRNTWNEGLDIVLHGEAVVVRDTAVLHRVADAYLAKYGDDWAFEVDEDERAFAGPALVYRVAPAQAVGFGKGPFSQTRWDFPAPGLTGGLGTC
jgi:nitroimidazol reductase NimA-like FMN-containing flavoprotein (pyridoxamine 5'-phosphate oxidase superfamily)